MTITSTKGDLDFKHYVDNAFIAYKAEPDSISDIIHRYLASTSDLYEDQKAIVVENLIPVIKPVEYLDEINSLNTCIFLHKGLIVSTLFYRFLH